MKRDHRGAERFFNTLPEACAISRLSHIHLLHWPVDLMAPLQLMQSAGFAGRLVTGRISTLNAISRHFPQINSTLDDHPTHGEPARQVLLEFSQGKEAGWMAVRQALEAVNRSPARPELHAQSGPDAQAQSDTANPEQATESPGGVWVFGSRDSGLDSLKKRFSHVETALYRGHMRLLHLPAQSRWLGPPPTRKRNKPPPPLMEDGFHHLDIENAPDNLTLATLPGLFSWRTLDPGTRLLLENLPPLSGKILDWGCGNGIIGTALALRARQADPDETTTHLHLSDDMVRAVRASRRTLELNGITDDQATVICEDGIGPHLRALKFDAVVTNPAFHRGVRNNSDAVRRFLGDITTILAPGGALWLVGNRFIDYGSLMEEKLRKVVRRAENDCFVVWNGLS